MNALYLTVFASLLLAGLGLLLFFHSASQRDRDHVDRLALLPLDDTDDFPVPSDPAAEADADPDPDPDPDPTRTIPTPAPEALPPAPALAGPGGNDNPLNEGEPDVR